MFWFISILLIVVVYLIIKSYFKKRSFYKIIVSTFLIVFFSYSFFTYDGALRLELGVVSGDFISAYTTGIKEVDFNQGDNYRHFIPTKDIQVTSGGMGYTRCSNYLVIKMCNYYGF